MNRSRRIAVAAPDVTPQKADEYMPLADPGALALNRGKDLMYTGVFHCANNTEQCPELQVQPPGNGRLRSTYQGELIQANMNKNR
jgi:hypothetical protein